MEDFSIPIDWNISIDDEGRTTVDEGPGMITAGGNNKQGKASGQNSAQSETPEGKDKKQGEQLTLTGRRVGMALVFIRDARALPVC